jgi:hypothetical protein
VVVSNRAAGRVGWGSRSEGGAREKGEASGNETQYELSLLAST